MTNRRQELEQKIAELQKELDAIPQCPFNWDEMNNEELKKLFTGQNFDWNSWANCPVGSLTGGVPSDLLLRELGCLTIQAVSGDWQSYMTLLRSIVRLRLEETAAKVPIGYDY